MKYDAQDDSRCLDDDKKNCKVYGRLYLGSAIKKGVCPEGTRVSTLEDWEHLLKVVDPDETSSFVLKAAGEWMAAGTASKATDTYGFSAMPGGFYDDDEEEYTEELHNDGHWWVYSKNAFKYVRMAADDNLYEFRTIDAYNSEGIGLSVRCVLESNHSIEVSHIAGLLASELGADVATAKRAGLLHDLGKAIDHEVEGSHVTIGVDLARRYKESEEVVHAIEAHHGDVEPHTLVACLVQAADAISASRPGARRENIENYVKRLEKLEEVSRSFPGIDSCYAIQAGREIRIMVKPEEVSEDQMVLLARDIAKKIEEELTYPGQIKVHVLRETKAVDYAK